jgi:hypothetical protein
MVGRRTETRRPGATSPGRRPRRTARSTAVVALTLIGLLATVVSRAPASAALTNVGGACGFHLGPPLETGAAGTLGFEFPAYPADPHQVCTVTVTGQASLDPVAGPAFTNVAGNHGTATFTLQFTGGQLPPGILWLWRPHCADPAAAGVVTLTIDGQTASSPVQPPASCLADLGGSSSLSFDFVDPSFASYVVGLAPTHDGHGYWGVWPSGNVRGVGDATQPSPLVALAATVVGAAADPSGGLWVVGADGGVFALGGAPFFGSLGGITLNAPVVGVAATPDGGGYWLVSADGGVFAFGDAGFFGSMAGSTLNAPMVGMAATHDGGGYWLVSADGGVFAFGDATFFGSMAGSTLNGPVVGMATPDSGGYWLAAHDGGVFAFGDATFEGSAGALDLVAPVFSMAGTPSGHGYWLSGADGGIFAYGDAGFFGTIPSL